MGDNRIGMFVFVIVGGYVSLALLRFKDDNHTDWRPTTFSDQMRRKINGKWQYRPQTDEEAYELWRDMQW